MGSVLKNCMITNACFMPLKTVKEEAGNLDGNRGLMSGLEILLDFGPKVKWYEVDLVGIAVVWDSLRDVINQEGSLY